MALAPLRRPPPLPPCPPRHCVCTRTVERVFVLARLSRSHTGFPASGCTLSLSLSLSLLGKLQSLGSPRRQQTSGASNAIAAYIEKQCACVCAVIDDDDDDDDRHPVITFGGDEALVARAGGSSSSSSSSSGKSRRVGAPSTSSQHLANGTALPCAPPPRAAGWQPPQPPHRQPEAAPEAAVVPPSPAAAPALAPRPTQQWASQLARTHSQLRPQQHQQPPRQQPITRSHSQREAAPRAAATDAADGWQWLAAPTVLAPPRPMSPTQNAPDTAQRQQPRAAPAQPQPAAFAAAASFRSAGRGAPQPAAAGPGAAEVSLEAPRPDGERLANEYVETPLRANGQQQQQQQLQRQRKQAAAAGEPPAPGKHCAATGKQRRSGAPVTKQPVSFTKGPGAQQRPGGPPVGAGPQAPDAAGLSIMCERCGKCRCESCREPPPLPSRWLCDNACYCSAETVLDYASCLCCAKGLFYHCSLAGSDDATACADEPCSCVGPRRLARWSCLSALALVLPCLLCYWPLRGCVALCEAGYAKHAGQGCSCEQPELGEKRLLAPESS
ncbi:zinc finger CCCH domain-containing protein 18-like [Phymastichus coffea]|uniref:zinc finger CCCH domain-containing protein 18-like n=1 Tax=Phymastichus coffea TaxID=108790 RepID=UPI00273B63C3|nr:zinc finger CCCH domain-containing protein 18-like [Phymastichus coffea]